MIACDQEEKAAAPVKGAAKAAASTVSGWEHVGGTWRRVACGTATMDSMVLGAVEVSAQAESETIDVFLASLGVSGVILDEDSAAAPRGKVRSLRPHLSDTTVASSADLQSMQHDVAADGENEKELYDKYTCFCETDGAALAEGFAAAETELAELGQAIEDVTVVSCTDLQSTWLSAVMACTLITTDNCHACKANVLVRAGLWKDTDRTTRDSDWDLEGGGCTSVQHW